MLVEFELIQKAQQGDAGAFNQIVSAYRRRIMGTISHVIGRPEDVEDVAQEVFIRLYFSLGQLRTAEVFEPWLYRLTVNASYDYLRKSRRRIESRMADLSEQQVMMADAVAGSRAQKRRKRKTAGPGHRAGTAEHGFRRGPYPPDPEGSRGVIAQRTGKNLPCQRERIESAALSRPAAGIKKDEGSNRTFIF